MSPQRAHALFVAQKNRAQRRGIGWEMTFKEWVDWWGEDIHRRGPRKDQLGMCRHHDLGPYKIGNIYKGTPKANAAERGLMQKCSRTYLHRRADRPGITRYGFKSYGNFAIRPDKALECAQEEYEWIPGE